MTRPFSTASQVWKNKATIKVNNHDFCFYDCRIAVSKERMFYWSWQNDRLTTVKRDLE